MLLVRPYGTYRLTPSEAGTRKVENGWMGVADVEPASTVRRLPVPVSALPVVQ